MLEAEHGSLQATSAEWPQAEPHRGILRDLHFSTCQTYFLLVQDTGRLRSSASQEDRGQDCLHASSAQEGGLPS